jgi:lipoprotein-anchoring transpeptidase ErfK/SrfK
MRSLRRSVIATAVAVALSLELGVVAVHARTAPVSAPSAAAPAPAALLVVAPALSGATATELAAPVTAVPAARPAAPPPASTARRRTPTRIRVARPAPKPKACPPTPRVPATRSTRAHAVDGSVAVYSAPGAAKPARTMQNPRPEDGMPLEFLVKARRGEWLKVQLPVRPNMTYGWIRVSEVELSGLPYRILVERCAHRVTVFQDGHVALRDVVAVGKPQTPTPLGESFVDYTYAYSMRSGYGPWLISVALFSEVLQDFGGGRGQIALHGTNASSSLGRDASHGCVRLPPDVSTRIAKLVKPGTPVTITP